MKEKYDKADYICNYITIFTKLCNLTENSIYTEHLKRIQPEQQQQRHHHHHYYYFYFE